MYGFLTAAFGGILGGGGTYLAIEFLPLGFGYPVGFATGMVWALALIAMTYGRS